MTTGNRGVRKVAARRRGATAAVLAALATALIALALPAFASAELFTVDTNNDEAKTAAGAVCETAFGQCSLRAAVEAADADSSFDVIDLPSPPFEGPLGPNSEIQLGSTLEITQPVTIVGHPVLGGPFIVPGVAVTGPAGAATFTVKSNAVTIEDIAIGGGEYGIEVPGAFTGLKATGNWFGIFLNGTPSPIGQAGILLGPGADEATIGDGTVDNRNVFTHGDIGIDIDGASDARILGNYIGVGPEGKGPATLNSGIEISDRNLPLPLALTEHNEVGGVLTPAEASTPACDGPCNVIATDGGTGVYVEGQTDETAEPTRIRGNYLGLEADGVTPVGPGHNLYGVIVQADTGCETGPANLIVGGTSPTETNFIVGGSVGIYAEGAENFTAAGNAIGIAPTAKHRNRRKARASPSAPPGSPGRDTSAAIGWTSAPTRLASKAATDTRKSSAIRSKAATKASFSTKKVKATGTW